MKSELKTTLMVACLFVTLAILGSVFNLSWKSTLTGNVVQNQEEQSGQVVLLNHNMNYDNRGDLRVSGTLQNVAEKSLGYVEVKIKFYDKDRLLLESVSESIIDLNAGEIWKFSSAYPGFDFEEVDSYEINIGEVW
jgi:hypothetical protein